MPNPNTQLQVVNPVDNMVNIPNDEIDLLALLRTIWRGKFLIWSVTFVFILVGGYYAYRIAVPMYKASTTVVLESRQEQVVDIASVMTGLSGDQVTVNTEVEVLRSRHLGENLVERLGLLDDPEFNESLRDISPYSIAGIKRLILPSTADTSSTASVQKAFDGTVSNVLKAISISNISKSLVFRISAVTTSARKSAEMANTLAELYIIDQLEVKFNATEQATEWLTNRVSELKIELEAAVSAVKEFDSGIELVSPEALLGLNRQLKDLRDRLGGAQEEYLLMQARLAALVAAGESGDIGKMNVAADDRTLSRAFDMVRDGTVGQDVFDARYTQIMGRASLDVERSKTQLELLDKSVRDLVTRIQSQSGDLVKLEQLQREAEASRLIYEYFLGRLKETSVQQGIQQADSRILSNAVIPTSPVAPKKTMILLLSALLGLMVGSAYVLAREMMQNTFRTPEDLEAATGHTVIGSIPKVPVKNRNNILEYFLSKPTSQAAEAIRNMRTSIMLSNVDHPPGLSCPPRHCRPRVKPHNPCFWL
jgi:uncharacterized protein involved in exopolysaccharide biosynthesis